MLTKKHMVLGTSYFEEYGRYPNTEIVSVPLVGAYAQQAVHLAMGATPPHDCKLHSVTDFNLHSRGQS